MLRCTRSRYGLVALAALALSFAEGVIASACASMEMTGTQATMVAASGSEDGPDDVAPHASRHDAAHQAGSAPGANAQERDHGRHAPECPLGPGAMQGCQVAASLPSPPVAADVIAAEGFEQFLLPAAPPRHLLGSALFRPPRV
jgi:hypothetical protein